MTRKLMLALSLVGAGAMTAGAIADSADAQRRGGGGQRASRPAPSRPAASRPSGGQRNMAASQRAGHGQGAQQHQVRRDASSSINHNANRNQNINRNQNVNRDRNVNRDINRDVNRDLNVDVDVHHDYGYRDWDDHYHPVARAAAVTTAAVATAAIIGSMVYTLPPSCVTVVRAGVSYYQCGSTWYQPTYVGTNIQYVVVESP